MGETRVSGILYREGEPTTDGRVIDANALVWDIPTPIVDNRTGEIIGKALLFACVDGVVSFEGVIDGDLPPDLRPAPTITELGVTDFGNDKRDGLLHVVSGRGRELRLVDNAVFEIASIRVDEEDNDG